MKLFAVIIVMAGLLFAATAAQKENRAEVALRAAMDKEIVDGDLKAAIEMYKRIVANPVGNRAVAAKALLLMGECYEKLGRADARSAYERLVREFVDQPEQVETARAKLAALGESRSKVAGSAMAVRRIWTGPEVDVAGAVSPDGKYLTFVDSDTGDLAVRDFETGRNRRLTNNGKESISDAFGSRWSPDGKQIVYDWYDGRVSNDGRGISDLRIINLNTAESRLLYGSRDGEEVNVYDWSPDGKHILAEVTKFDRSSNMASISVADGSMRFLNAQGWSHARFSPDGHYIAGSHPPRAGTAEQDVFILSLADGLETPLVEHPAEDSMLDWSPDGNWIFFASDRSGAWGIWAMQVSGGKARGVAQPIELGAPQIVPMGVTRSGSLYYGIATLATNVYVARFDAGTGRITGQPEKAVQRFEGLSSEPSYSPDGRYLTYVCAKGPLNGMDWNRQNILRIRSLETGAEREIVTGIRSIDTLRWFPDNRNILLAGHHDGDSKSLYKVDTLTGQVAVILNDAPGVRFRDHDTSADGKAFYYVRIEKAKDLCQILLRNLENGGERELYRAPAAESFFITRSPDGKWLAFLNRTLNRADNRIFRVIPADGGEVRELFRGDQKDDATLPIAWTADSRYILFSRHDSSTAAWALWRAPVAGGKPEKLGLDQQCDSVSAHPNGRLIAFSLYEKPTNEVWVMENFFPILKPAR